MGTEVLSFNYVYLFDCPPVKLNNPLMGTEVFIFLCMSFMFNPFQLVKLNNPLMGTEVVGTATTL